MINRFSLTAITRALLTRLRAVLFLALAATVLLLVPTAPAAGVAAVSIRYAAPVPAGSGDCSTWLDACTLQTALTGAVAGHEIWVKAGVHKPTTNPAERTASFTLVDGVSVYGGFAGGEQTLSQRNPARNVTVLSGDIDDNDFTDSWGVVTDAADIAGANSYHVVVGSDGASPPVLDGVTVTAGQANGTSPDHRGGGMYNEGGFNVLARVRFRGNTAAIGGGIANFNSSFPTVANVSFSGNLATGYGGGMANYNNSSATVTNVTFAGNAAGTAGGGMFNYDSRPDLNNAIMWGNTAGVAGAEIGNSAGATPTIAYSDVEGSGGSGAWDGSLGTDGGNNVDVDPLFMDVAAGNLRLSYGSSLIDAGNNAAVPLWLKTDLDGKHRISGGTVDMGVYEYAYHLFAAPVAADGGDCSGWSDACTLQTALASAVSGEEIWVKAGVHKPTSNPLERAATFALRNGVAVYGGFAGTETLLSQRDPAANATVLSGDIDNNDATDASGIVWDAADIVGSNSYHVVSEDDTDGTAILDGVTITAGQANVSPAHSGGGGMSSQYGSPTLRNVAFLGNTAFTGGGMRNYYSGPMLVDVVFSGNFASSHGGGIENYGSSPTLRNLAFENNRAGVRGGALYNYGSSSPSLYGATFNNNAGGVGGAINNYTNSNALLHDVSFAGNMAQTGGAMANYNSHPILDKGAFEENIASIDGGGMFNYESDPVLTDVTISGNTAENCGGMYNYSSDATLNKVRFRGNHATQDGGGMCNLGTSHASLNSVTFSGNLADGYGGGMSNDSFTGATLHNVSFNGNRAGVSGGGMYNSSSSPILSGVIMWQNSAGYSGDQIENGGSSTPFISYSDVEGSSGSGGSWDSTLGIDAGNNVDVDPRFVTPVDPNAAPTTDGYLALLPGSPVVDIGTNTNCSSEDVRGVVRPQGTTCDIGAYERVTLVLAGTPMGGNMVELSWTVTGYGPYDLWQSSQPYGGYSSTVSGLSGPTHTRNVNSMAFFEVHAEGIGEVSNRVGVVPFALVPGQ